MSFDPYSTRSGRLGDFPAGTLIARLIALMPRTHRELADIVGAPDAEVRNALDTGIRQGRVIREPGRPAVYRAATEAEVIDAVRGWGHPVTDDNEADALALLKASVDG